MSSFVPLFRKYPDEARIVGELVAGYGELEFGLGRCLGAALADNEAAFRALFRTRGEEQRIQIADALMRRIYIDAGFEDAYCDAIADLGFCKTVRNQYAHWAEPKTGGLSFVELESGAKKNTTMASDHKGLALALPEEQQKYFQYVKGCTIHLCNALPLKLGRGAGCWETQLPKRWPRPLKYVELDSNA